MSPAEQQEFDAACRAKLADRMSRPIGYPPSQIEDMCRRIQAAHEFRVSIAVEVLKLPEKSTSTEDESLIRAAAWRIIAGFFTSK